MSTVRSLDRLAASLLLLSGCGFVNTEISYRDLGVDARANADAGPDGGQVDSAVVDAAAPDAPVRIGADATRAVLVSIGENVLMPALRDFESDAAALVVATEALRVSGTPEARDAARAAWRESMRSWERVEMMQVGPAGLLTVTLGGRALRDQTYAWPLLNRCRVDQETVEDAHADATMLAVESVNVRGLAAIEYLLFFDAPTNGCGASHTINASGAWAALDAPTIAVRRAA